MNKKFFNNFTFNYGKNILSSGVIDLNYFDPDTRVFDLNTITRPFNFNHQLNYDPNIWLPNSPKLISEIPLFRIPFDFSYKSGDWMKYWNF